MQPFEPSAGSSAAQIAYDERRVRYLESIIVRSTIVSERLTAWRAANPAPLHPEDPHPSQEHDATATICDAVADIGLKKLDPGLDEVRAELQAQTLDEQNAQLRTWLTKESDRGRPLARALLARANPSRTQELFGWTRTGIDPVTYWAPSLNSLHMTHLLETADFGANELIRILYMLAPVPEHLHDAALQWRDSQALGCDPNFPVDGLGVLHRQFTEFKYWMDDPFDCAEFKGDAQEARSNNDFQKMHPGEDMTYWSENHRILFATVEYLAGQFWPNEQFIAMRAFRESSAPRDRDMSGAAHRDKARIRVLRWLNERLRLGFSEWNSPSYYSYDVSALVNLVDFAIDEEVRTRATMVLDLLVFDLATNLNGGALAGSAGRAYFDDKKCIWDQRTRDICELLFGSTGHFTTAYNPAIFLAASPCYRPPDALLILGSRPPARATTRARVSIGFEESADNGVGFRTLDDMEFWWSRAGFVTRQTVRGSQAVAAEHHLLRTEPFKTLLPLMESFAAALDTAEDIGGGILGALAFGGAGFALAGPLGMLGAAAVGAYGVSSQLDFSIEDAAAYASILTEGSLLSRANLYTHHDGGASLSSVQSFRPGQLNFQGLSCVAALDNGAMVWTSYPSAGSYLELRSLADDLPGPLGILAGLLTGAFGISEDPAIFPVSHDGPTWWTGNVVQPRVIQQGNAAISIYASPRLQKLLFGERTHAWFPKAQFERVLGPEPARCNREAARWFFGAVGDTYIGLFCARESDWTNSGPWKDREIRAEGSTNVFITQIGTAKQYGSFAGFVAAVTRARVHISDLDDDPKCNYDVPGGQRLSLHYNGPAAYGGIAINEDNFPRHQGPAARITWQQDRYAIQHANASVVHDLVAGTRVLGDRLPSLDHPTPLTYYAQNMGLLPSLLYKGTNRAEALAHVVAVLRARQPDIVGLSEMWVEAEREQVRLQLADLYPHSVEGPHDPILETPLGDLELMGGGLLLLSRHPIIVKNSTVYRQSSGDDSLANKGVLHARIAPKGHPCEVDVFVTHTQSPEPTIGGSVSSARTAIEGQIRHLASFLRACRDPMVPAMLGGDFNVGMYGHRDLYDYLIGALGNPFDPMAKIETGEREHPLGTSEDEEISSFQEDHPLSGPEDPHRFGRSAERLDYVFCFPGLLYDQHVSTSRVVAEQWTPGRDMSDHYGVDVSVAATTQQLPADRDVQGIRVDLHSARCLQPTSGPGDDEVSFTLNVRAGGQQQVAETPVYENVNADTGISVDNIGVELPGSDELTVLVSGSEDDWFSDDDLGSAVRTFSKDELLALADAGPTVIGWPILRGDGAEYEVDMLITVTADSKGELGTHTRRP